MSSIIKTFYSNKVYHNFLENNQDIKIQPYNPSEVRFTKVLTKYSTEYNNIHLSNFYVINWVWISEIFNLFYRYENNNRIIR